MLVRDKVEFYPLEFVKLQELVSLQNQIDHHLEKVLFFEQTLCLVVLFVVKNYLNLFVHEELKKPLHQWQQLLEVFQIDILSYLNQLLEHHFVHIGMRFPHFLEKVVHQKHNYQLLVR